MIYGIGTDIVRTDRIKSAVEKWGQKFLNRVFTENEISYSYKKKDPIPSLAVRFAAKEAFIKAISSEDSLPFTDIEIINDAAGSPSIILSGIARKSFQDKQLANVHVSLSHERDYAVASVVIEGNT